MASNHLTLAFASDMEVSAIGFGSINEAVSFYSDAAIDGFTQCRFVAAGLANTVEGVEPSDFVMVVTGVTQLRAYIDTFGSRPANLRGWLLFSNSNYFLSEMELIFGRRGGNTIYVDQYLCGADGKPVVPEEFWDFKDYFADDDQVVVNGTTYVKAWVVERANVAYEAQNVTAINGITYCAKIPHTLPDGSVVRVARKPKIKKSIVLSDVYKLLLEGLGAPFVKNGDTLASILTEPVFLHALVKCTCGNTMWTVGDWSCYKSLCCGVVCKPLCNVAGIVNPGSAVVTRTGLGSGIKYYCGMFLRHILDVDGVSVWRVIRLQSAGESVTSTNFEEFGDVCPMDTCHYSLDSRLAVMFKLNLLSGDFCAEVRQAIASGVFSVGNFICDVTDDVLGKPWFLKKLGVLADAAWTAFVASLRKIKVMSSQLVDLAKALACASVSVINRCLVLAADVPPIFKECFAKFVSAIAALFKSTCDTVKVARHSYPRLFDYVLLDNHLVKMVTQRITGKKQAGLTEATFADVILGATTNVTSDRTEACNVGLVLCDYDVPVLNTGYTAIIGGKAFFCSEGYYRFMATPNVVLDEPVFRAAAELNPVFECEKPDGFPVLVASDVAELCVKVDQLLPNYSTSYKRYESVIRGEQCFIRCIYDFRAPSFIRKGDDAEKFVKQCEVLVSNPLFFEFYTQAHEAVDLDQYVNTACTLDGFSHMAPAVPKPHPLFLQIDGGAIWRSVVRRVSAVADFVRNLKVSFGLEGIIVSAARKFKQWAKLLAQMYNEFLNSVSAAIYIAGVKFIHYATTVPQLAYNGCLYALKKTYAATVGLQTEEGIDSFYAFDHCQLPVTPRLLQVEDVNLEEADFKPPVGGGCVAVINGYSFYVEGDSYYPTDCSAIHSLRFRKLGGAGVAFSEDVAVKTIDPVYKVRLDFEFEDDSVVALCKKTIGKSIKFNGTEWDKFVAILETALGVLAKHVTLPPYFIYDDHGGKNLSRTVVVSQWPPADVDESCDDSDDDDDSDHEADEESSAEHDDDPESASTDEQLMGQDTAPDSASTDESHETEPNGASLDEDLSAKQEEALNALDNAIGSASAATEEEEVNDALSFMTESSPKPCEPTSDTFAYPFKDYNGVKVLDQQSNNCWVNSTLLQLQLLGVIGDDSAMALFKVGRVGPMVKRCYEAVGAIKGSLGDVSQCMEVLLRDVKTLTVHCDTVCDCGSGSKTFVGCAFRFEPTTEPFPYGCCQNCKQVLLHTITSISGTGVFCREPTPFDISVMPIRPLCAANYVGAVDGGHYMTNIYTNNVAVDGHGVHGIANTGLNTICVKDVDWSRAIKHELIRVEKPKKDVKPEPPVKPLNAKVDGLKPFVSYKGVEFYQGAFKDLLELSFDFVVNAANEQLSHGGGVARAIDEHTGGELQSLSDRYVKAVGPLKVGTGAYIKCKAFDVFNVVGPRKGKHAKDLLVKSYDSVFSVPGVPLMPLLSIGIFRVPIEDSLSALFACVGDRVCKCFCYLDAERDAILQYVAGLSVVDEVEVKQETAFTPRRMEGSCNFYDCNPKALVDNGVTRFVVFTKPSLDFCDTTKVLDTYFKSLLTNLVKDYVSTLKGKVVPAGNCVTLRCTDSVSVTFVVLPTDDDPNFETNAKRAFQKCLKLKGTCVYATTDADVLRRIVKHSCFGFIANDNVISAVFTDGQFRVEVTQDQRTYSVKSLDASKTMGEQLGTCSVDNTNVSDQRPTSDISKVTVAPAVDWDVHYGFVGAASFHILNHEAFEYPSIVQNGKRVLKTSDNNCWVNAVCLQLQFANAKFVGTGLQTLWDEYLVGNVAGFVHWLYWLAGVQKGDPGDAEDTLNLISKFLQSQGHVVVDRTTVDSCCSSQRTLVTPVVNGSILRMGVDDGACKHGSTFINKVVSIDGTVILVNVGPPISSAPTSFIQGLSYTSFNNTVGGVGHYTVYDSTQHGFYDGDAFVRGELAMQPVTALVARHSHYVVKDPVKSFEQRASAVVDSLNFASEKFFTFGDFVSRNVITMLVWFFSLLSLLLKSVRRRDFRVLAGAPERSGVIISRSIKYNVRALRYFMRLKAKWVCMFLKACFILYTCYATCFMIIRFSFVSDIFCSGDVDGYANSSFDKNAYCDGQLCKVCLFGYDELADFPHTTVVWEHLKDPFVINVIPLFYLGFLAIFGGTVTRIMVLYFVSQYVNMLGAYLGVQDSVWFLQFFPFDVFGDEIVVLFLVVRVLMFLKHVLFGCDKPSCLACSKSARLKRVPVSTIVSGANKSFYVNANGGTSFCKKHNFYCVNCDSYGLGCTFINDVVAAEVGNVTKLNVQATGPAFVEIDKVEFNNGFYYLYSGNTFWKYNYDITDSRYSCKEALKKCNVAADFIICNNTGSNMAQVKNACVYFSQLLCKPIKIVDSTLVSTLGVDFSTSIHSAFVEILTDSFGKDLSNCTTMSQCRATLGFDDISDEDFTGAVANAHRYGLLLTDISFNNFITSYAKPEEKMSVHDLAICMRSGARVANHNVLVKENVPVVWSAEAFNALSEESRKYVVKTSKVKGLTFMLSFNNVRMHTTIPSVAISGKKGGSTVSAFFKNLRKILWCSCTIILCLFFVTSLWNFAESYHSGSEFGYKYIENGALKDFSGPLDCVHNIFDDFMAWHHAKYGVQPINSRRCPIVVGVDENVRTIPGVSSGVMLVGKTLVFAVKSVYSSAGLCYDEFGAAAPEQCLFNSACTTLKGLGGTSTYCYRSGLVSDSGLYRDLLHDSHYFLPDGNYVKFPEVISRGFGFRTVRTAATTYCRVGQCVDSKQGVCFGLDRFLVYSAESGSDFVCGTGLMSLLYNVFGIFTRSIPVVVLSGQIMFNCVVAFLAVSCCFLFTKFKRLFGDMSFGVFTVCCCVLVNNLSYIITQNYMGLVFYTVLYFFSTKTVRYAWIWHIGYFVAYFLVAPWWLLGMFLASALTEFLPSMFKLKVSTQLFDGEKFVGSFETAAMGTFVLDMRTYEKLVNSTPGDKIRQYAATYNKYKYYSGGANEADYRLACFAHLAKAMMDFGSNHQDMLYSPPTVSYNSTLQAGLKKMAQPSGVVERCIVRVSYGNMVLNGLWLGDTVYCPRHVLAASTTTHIDYEHALAIMRLHNFSISYGNTFLGVVGCSMKGALLLIKVGQNNVHTPGSYTFRTLKPGDSFNILACYDGTATGVYGVNLRTNHTIRGSFINGACGSPGFNIHGSTVEFCYLHQLELGSGCHVGSDMNGAMYGGYEDQPSFQIEGVSNLVSENVVAFLYGALLNGCNWWLDQCGVTVEAYNDWAHSNGCTSLSSTDCFTILAAKTGVEVSRVLAAIQRLNVNFGGKAILGYTSLTDEFTVGEIIKQMFGVNLQSGIISRSVRNVLLVGLFVLLFWSELVIYTPFFWVSPAYITPLFLIVSGVSILCMSLLKHKTLFLQMFLIPAVIAVSAYNLAYDLEIRTWMATKLDYHASILSFNIQGIFNIMVCCVVVCLHAYRCVTRSSSVFTMVVACITSCYSYVICGDALSAAMAIMLNITGNWFVGAGAYRLATYIVLLNPALPALVGDVKAIVFVYVAVGYVCCVFYGILYWVNRFCKLSLGVYDFMVSPAEFKYMVANGLRAPTGAFDSLFLSARLLGIGGQRTIKISTVQSKLTDVKCTNVVLMGCLSSMNIQANSAEWNYCVDLHNKINLCNDLERAQEYLLALLAFFLSKNSAFGLDDLLDSYFDNNTVLQAVATTYANMPSYIMYENARQAYEEAISNRSSPQLIKQLKHAMNRAKGEFDHEAATQRKIDRMAEQAAAQMFKEARAVNKKSKVTSAMHAMLFSMLRRLDMSSVDIILNLARNGTVPLSIIPALCATRLSIIVSDFESYAKLFREGCIHYAGTIWSVADIKNNDGKPVHQKEVTSSNAENLSWPLCINAERIVKLQNNEVMPGKLKQRSVKAEGDGVIAEGKALYNTENGRTFMYAFLADKPDLKVVKWESDDGVKVIELEPPCKFLVDTPNGPHVKFLYFVRNLNTLRRGAVLGFVGATVRLQAGKQTEQVMNSSLLTMCAFSTDPAKTYLDAVKSGVKPIGNCVKMLANGAGNGQAITNGVEANTSQDSYGGASVCLWCRAYVEHPAMDGFCKYKGKYVQVPIGTVDPIRYCLENEVCKVCGCWLNNGCSCDRTSIVQSFDSSYLNEQGALVQLD
ncbi:replicase protein1a [Myotis lucifugus coronavirus]|nr:replicase protein1a [Myotis lucifugus coronavirus]